MSRLEELCIDAIKMLSVDAVERARSGHPGMPLGDASMAYVLWQHFLRHNPRNPRWPNRDRFILSAGHGSMLLYSLLYLTGYPLSLKDIKSFRQWGSRTPGHPEYCPEVGVETTTGPLGQGFATGVGMAMAERYLRELFNRPGFPVVDYYIYGILSDGDIMEGVQAEAASLAGHLRLGKLVYLYSDNKVTIEGSTELSMSEDVPRRYEALGWHVQRADGYDLKGLREAIRRARAERLRPSLIVVRTYLAHGCPNKQSCAEAHGAPLGREEIRLLRECAGWPQRDFYVPSRVLRHMRQALKRGRALEARWRRLFNAYRRRYPELARLWEDFQAGRFELDGRALPKFRPQDGPMATRKASGVVLNALAPRVPQLLGGSADLAPSNNTYLKGFPDYTPQGSGRNIHFGVREHAMAAALNGMALSGMLIPYGGTFLVFSDYLKPALRLAAMMRTHVVYIFTHDSIGVGEDGPTHQPVEQLAALRAVPGLLVIRPADANETAQAWRLALQHRGPVCLVLSRQSLPIIDRARYGPASGIRRGGYVISDCQGTPELILLASGSEVHLCLQAAERLKRAGRRIRVVNMASFELFEAQSRRYREAVLPPQVRARVAVEAASAQPWYRYVGLDGEVIGVRGFGASAPGKVMFEKYGFTVENILRVSRRLLKAPGQ
jgi:transketolase